MSSCRIMGSPQFTFVCGEDEEPVTVHEVALATLSQPLNRLMHGPMREAGEKLAKLPYVEKEDFVRLCEFAYRGRYTIPAAVRKPANDGKKDTPASSTRRPLTLGEVDTEVLIAEIEERDVAEQQRVKEYEKQEKEKLATEERTRDSRNYRTFTRFVENQLPLAQRFVRRQYIFGTPFRTEIKEGCKVKGNTHELEDFTPIFLAHAKIYTLAGFFMIRGLEDLALENLRATLETFRIHKTRVGDVIELVRYTYENTRDRDEDNEQPDDLRQLVLEYAALNYTLIDTADFYALLEKGGQFVVDLLKLMSKEGIMVFSKKS
jgi:hypothetical protein